jgi:hypothetical protein
VNGKTPLYLTVLVLGLLGAVLMISQPYSADWPRTPYAKPAREYIHAALRQDSVRLARLSISPEPVIWALEASRAHHDSLALWKRRIEAWTGKTLGDTAEVFIYPTTDACGQSPIVFRFVGSGRNIRVLQASSRCWGS